MKIVLLERVENLGTIGDVVDVKPGFARNYLLPTEKALRATKANMIRFEAEREYLEAKNAEAAEKARTEGADLDGKSYVVIRQAGETGILYGSVTSRDIADLIGGNVKRSMVALEQPIKELGLSDVRIKLHPEVSVTVTINVARTEDEAERQAKGEDVIKTQMDEDREQAGEDAKERAELAKEMFDDEGEAIFAEESQDAAEDKPEEKDE
ncbi:MAG TPA: 50S ribosomal protein L9 [Hellea balneolensis]|uniref:Large ribosomal subunit protein bL9 n=1 Tax=Hellea balneolensis TaxID=287478 RepID=A0A7C5LZC3_9PROT|nr:50S ribosomal protein L9 [Hellea balneolensis]